MRYVCIDFETNGFSGGSSWTLPFSNYPIQLSVDVVEDGEITHAYDTLISGATSFAIWVKENVPITVTEASKGIPFKQMLEDLAGILREGDTIVAHNISFDINLAIGRTADKLGITSEALQKILQAPRFCTMQCAYTKALQGGVDDERPLCTFQVVLDNAHDARADSAALAECVAEAWRRGVMLDERGGQEERTTRVMRKSTQPKLDNWLAQNSIDPATIVPERVEESIVEQRRGRKRRVGEQARGH